MRTAFVWFRTGASGGLSWTQQRTFRCYKSWIISWPTVWLLVTWGGFCSTELVSKVLYFYPFQHLVHILRPAGLDQDPRPLRPRYGFPEFSPIVLKSEVSFINTYRIAYGYATFACWSVSWQGSMASPFIGINELLCYQRTTGINVFSLSSRNHVIRGYEGESKRNKKEPWLNLATSLSRCDTSVVSLDAAITGTHSVCNVCFNAAIWLDSGRLNLSANYKNAALHTWQSVSWHYYSHVCVHRVPCYTAHYFGLR
jgi:hypothetical protein